MQMQKSLEKKRTTSHLVYKVFEIEKVTQHLGMKHSFQVHTVMRNIHGTKKAVSASLKWPRSSPYSTIMKIHKACARGRVWRLHVSRRKRAVDLINK